MKEAHLFLIVGRLYVILHDGSDQLCLWGDFV